MPVFWQEPPAAFSRAAGSLVVPVVALQTRFAGAATCCVFRATSRRVALSATTACAGRYDDEGVISLRQRVVNRMQSEGRVMSHLRDVFACPSQADASGSWQAHPI